MKAYKTHPMFTQARQLIEWRPEMVLDDSSQYVHEPLITISHEWDTGASFNLYGLQIKFRTTNSTTIIILGKVHQISGVVRKSPVITRAFKQTKKAPRRSFPEYNLKHVMDPFFPMNYVGHQQNIPKESKLAAYTAGRSPVLGGGPGSSSSANHLAQNLASMSLNDGNQSVAAPTIGGSGSAVDPTLFSKPNSFAAHGENVSPTTGNGSPPTSRDSTPVPPVTYQHAWMDQENVGGTTYYYAEDAQQEIQEEPSGPHAFPSYSVYAGTPSHLKDFMTRSGNPGPSANPVVHPNTQNNSFFAPEELKLEIMHKNAVTLSQANPHMFPDLPAQIDHYHEICPLEPQAQKSVTFGYPNSVYKAINSKNGFTYCLRRIHGFRLPSGKWLGLVEAWKQISHCNLVQLREIFTTKAFGDSSLIFVYDYFASAETLMVRHFDRNNQVNGYIDPFSTGDPSVPRPYSHQKNALLRHHANMLPENLLWAYIVQLSSVIRTIHTAGLAVRSLDPTKILVTSRTRPSIRMNCCGIYDIVTFDPSASPAQLAPFYQQEDLLALGKLILALACNSLLAVQRENLSTSLELISRTYSSDLRNLVVYLMNPRGTRSINDIMPMIGARFYNQLDAANARAELLENCLAREIENGRLFRLIVKLCAVVERNELNMDPAWAETGDRYLLKLFRDYVFHQVTADGRPWMDLSHVVYCLNRLDTGSLEKICLMSRDEQSILITTYAELKQCMEQSFGEILAATTPNAKHNQLPQMVSPVQASQSHTL
ncbi:unnamed protein product [Allacma fusca]|uniref:PAN2-PAN3 deadenylation complex subunit PAN3 n=1 Tax=Allacma fusca TaxID=39272 RepID=A0A8J2JXH9_9HEXA|nr:unnamed protein product [Allacma fusca]